jgi:hypothetical protein
MHYTGFAVAVALLMPSAAAFVPASSSRFTVTSTILSAATVEPPQREAPGAGKTPAWEDRQGKSPEEFLKSNMNKEDLSEMWECPLTRWDSDG